MMMVALCAVAPLPGKAGTVYATQQEAAKAATDDGYMLVVYAKGWDRFSEPFCKKVIESPEIQKAAGNAGLILAPFYQYATGEERSAQSAVWGSLSEPSASSMETYPCILMYDKSGYLYARVQGTSFLKGTMAEIAAEIKTKLDAKKAQEEIMAKAANASGAEKAKLIAEACEVKGIEHPRGARDMIRAADPQDESGMVRRMNFDYYGFSQKYCGKASDGGLELSTDKTIREMQAMLKDQAYTPEQKQVIHAVIIGTLRRSGASDTQLKSAVMEMKRLAPDSHMGISADQYIKTYASGSGKKR